MTDSEPVTTVIHAAERTLAAPSARLGYESNFVVKRGEPSFDTRFLPMWWRVAFGVGRVAWRIAKTAWNFIPTDASLTEQTAEGVIEPARLRYMMDFGSYAELFNDGDFYGGRSGRSLHTLNPWPPDAKNPDVLWALMLLRGTVKAELIRNVEIHGVTCQELLIHADLENAAALTDFRLKSPPRQDVRELHRIELTVTIDDRHIRRIAERESHGAVTTTKSFEFWDFGVDTSYLDWTRLPDRSAESNGYATPRSSGD